MTEPKAVCERCIHQLQLDDFNQCLSHEARRRHGEILFNCHEVNPHGDCPWFEEVEE